MKAFVLKYKWIIIAVAAALTALVIAFLSGGSVEEAKRQEKQLQRPFTVNEATADSADVTAYTAPVSNTEAVSEAFQATTNASASTIPATAAQSTVAPNTAPYEGNTAPASAADSTQPQNTNGARETVPAQTQYQTVAPSTESPAPATESAPKPVKPTCTISVSCATIRDNMNKLDPDLRELVPDDGWILKPVKVTLRSGDTVFEVLKRVCRQHNIHMEYSNTPVYHSAYIEGIGNLYEFDCGANSGWMYSVNGAFPGIGCSQQAVGAGDVIEWKYTCNLGYDVGGGAR